MANAERLIRIVDKVVKADFNPSTTRWANKIRTRLRATPMLAILDKVPGNTVMAKAKRIGVSRQTFYYWLNGHTRPNIKQSKRIAALTGVSVNTIRGL